MSFTLKSIVIYAVALFVLLSVFLLIQHEVSLMNTTHGVPQSDPAASSGKVHLRDIFAKKILKDSDNKASPSKASETTATISFTKTDNSKVLHELNIEELEHNKEHEIENEVTKDIKHTETELDTNREHKKEHEKEHEEKVEEIEQYPQEKKGLLTCNGKLTDSEVIYWKLVPGDSTYESPITPHHEDHHDKYLTFEYDAGGWNNVRMGMECLLVIAHATGRTIVIPPQQHLYLLGQTHKDKHDKEAHDEMGFEDFFDLELLRSHQGLHVLHMKEFLQKEGVTGGLKGQLPPHNSSDAWGSGLWHYLKKVADVQPMWRGKYVAFPAEPKDFSFTDPKHLQLVSAHNVSVKERMHRFGGDRSAVHYDPELQEAHHMHFSADPNYRLLQHHYAFAFFEDSEMQSFYRRFIRDYMRYKDEIQCAGHNLVAAVRAEALAVAPQYKGEYYALHIRRGDFQFKDVKIGAAEIVANLHYQNGTAMIPKGALVYVSTDDPDGLCKGCLVQRKPCEQYTTPKPPGCPEDTSWKAFTDAGWQIRFLRDFQKQGQLAGVNPNTYGMVESIVCSRAVLFAGTYFSTFTGYIHRMRGYHGLGESTYYHSKKFLFHLQMKKSVGHGFSREWRAGWTDDEGELI